MAVLREALAVLADRTKGSLGQQHSGNELIYID